MSVMPPAIDSWAFVRLLARPAGAHRAEPGRAACALQQLLKLAEASPLLSEVHADGLPAGTSVRLDIDRAKAEAMGVGSSTSAARCRRRWARSYVNDFPTRAGCSR
jgi:multidrug efflux pump